MNRATTCLIALGACLGTCAPAQAGPKAARPTFESEDSRGMYDVQAHLRAAEEKVARLKEDAARPNPSDRMSEADRAAAKKQASKEIETASYYYWRARAKLDAPKAHDFQQRLAAVRKDFAGLDKPAAPRAPAK